MGVVGTRYMLGCSGFFVCGLAKVTVFGLFCFSFFGLFWYRSRFLVLLLFFLDCWYCVVFGCFFWFVIGACFGLLEFGELIVQSGLLLSFLNDCKFCLIFDVLVCFRYFLSVYFGGGGRFRLAGELYCGAVVRIRWLGCWLHNVIF